MPSVTTAPQPLSSFSPSSPYCVVLIDNSETGTASGDHSTYDRLDDINRANSQQTHSTEILTQPKNSCCNWKCFRHWCCPTFNCRFFLYLFLLLICAAVKTFSDQESGDAARSQAYERAREFAHYQSNYIDQLKKL